MKTKIIFFFWLFFCFGLLNGFCFGQTLPSNGYSPEGKWVVKEPPTVKDPNESSVRFQLYVPTIISCRKPDILNSNTLVGSNNLINTHYQRRSIYKELFMELMLQTTSDEHSLEYEVSKPLSTAVKNANYSIKMLAEVDVINKSSSVFRELPYQLKLVSLVFSVNDKVEQAGADAAALFASLAAFEEARYKLINQALVKATAIDPEMKLGLNDAYNEIQKKKKQSLDELKSQMQTEQGAAETTNGLIKMAAGGIFGKIVASIAGGGIMGTALATPFVTAWIFQLGRTMDAEKAEASIVLLSSIDRALLDKADIGVTASDNYMLMQMRSHLSYALWRFAITYEKNMSMEPDCREIVRTWVNGFPYYDFVDLKLLKIKAINEIDIKLSDDNLSQSNKIENFRTFFLKFKSDPIFQKSRIIFPITYEILQGGSLEYEIKKIESKDWKFYAYSINPTSEYSVEIETESNTTKIFFLGKGCGINAQMIFILKEGKWFYFKMIDHST